MIKSIIIINECKHYLVNEQGSNQPYFVNSNFLVENDNDIKHPFGAVYKPTKCTDTLIRFVIQPDSSILIFKANEWNKPTNPFFSKILKINQSRLNFGFR
jgi:hypothetical protein